MTSTKHFDRKSLALVAITVGFIHIFGSLWNTFGAVIELTSTDPEFDENYCNDAIMQISIAFLFAFSGFFLIFGTYKESHLMLLPWLVLEAFGLILYFLYYAINLIDPSLLNWQTFALTMFNFVIIGLCVYVWFGMLSLYQIFREENQYPNHDDEEILCSDSNSNQVLDKKPYFISMEYTKLNLPPSQLKY